ncbi:glycosyltransferase [bacterium]|nr:glycosyltransferase [bacterium]MBU1991041.1 glycosyltransferase [bacterium]
MFVSLIIPTYKDVEALELILDALKLQSCKDFEVVIAEDDDSEEVKNFLAEYKAEYTIKHFSHEDKGWRKAKALNGAIELAKGEYLIFFDGDCLPYSTFVQAHVLLSEKNRVLCGRRVNTGDALSKQLRDKEIRVQDIENNFFGFWGRFKKDGARHIEQGLYLFPQSFFYRGLIRVLDKKKRLVGCNFSAFKEDMIKINGFDTSYPSGDVADDVDVEWRLNAIGVENKSCKYAANLIHLNHSRKDRREAHRKNFELMLKKQKKNEYFCKEGMTKINDAS